MDACTSWRGGGGAARGKGVVHTRIIGQEKVAVGHTAVANGRCHTTRRLEQKPPKLEWMRRRQQDQAGNMQPRRNHHRVRHRSKRGASCVEAGRGMVLQAQEIRRTPTEENTMCEWAEQCIDVQQRKDTGKPVPATGLPTSVVPPTIGWSQGRAEGHDVCKQQCAAPKWPRK